MPSLLVILPLLAQAGAASSVHGLPDPYSASSLPIEIIEKQEDAARRRSRQGPDRPVGISGGGCTGSVEVDAARSAQMAQTALDGGALGRERVRAGMCLGLALSKLERFAEARDAFTLARDATEADDHVSRARLGAMAGNAAFASGEQGQALMLLGAASREAETVADPELTASIALDQARALVAVDQTGEAGAMLAKAREAQPDNPQAWLLSATLSRRLDKMIEAQAQIETAAKLAPRDPEIGLEAGVIAMLSGNEAAARRSWRSVKETAPGSPAATTAEGYLAQLGPQSEVPQSEASEPETPEQTPEAQS